MPSTPRAPHAGIPAEDTPWTERLISTIVLVLPDCVGETLVLTPCGTFEAKGCGVDVDDTERAELIAALHQAATFAESLLDLNTRLLDALSTGENRPDSEELEYLRAGLSRWREQVMTLRQRINGLTVEPPERMQ